MEPRRQDVLKEKYMDQRIVNSQEYKNLLIVSEEMKGYFKLKALPPSDESYHYLEVIKKYGKFLDKLGIPNAIPKYHYRNDNKDTWKYLNVTIKGDRFIRGIENPTFKAA